MKPTLSMVIPCYMEAERLPPTLMKWKEFIEKMDFTIETILVIEPSQDSTLEVAKEWEKKIEGLQMIVNTERLGKGGSVRRGLLEAKGEIRAFMDADGSTGFNFFYEAYQTIRSGCSQVVIGSRGLKNSRVEKKQNLVRQRLGVGFRWMTKYLMGIDFEDTQCGAKMFHSSTIYPLFYQLREYGFAFDVEILLKARWVNISVLELPCQWKDVKGSTVHPLLDGWKMLRSVIAMKLFFMFHPKEKSSFGKHYQVVEGH